MERFRQWRESLKNKSDSNNQSQQSTSTSSTNQNPATGTGADTNSSRYGGIANQQGDGTTSNTASADSSQSVDHKRANGDSAPNRMDSLDKSASGTVIGATPAPLSPTAATASPTSPNSSHSTLSFAELDRLRRDRHAIFVSILSDPDQFAQFLRFLPALQQHELLFICEINQLIEKSTQFEEAEIMVQAIKIANIFLRNADASSATTNTTSITTSTSTQDADASVLQVQSIQPATRRHLQQCIPLTLPPHLQLAGAPSPSPSTSPPVGSYPKTDTKAILTLLEIARDQVEEGLSKKSLQKFLDLLNNPDGGRSASISAMTDDPTISLQWDYTFDDCYAAIASNQDESGGLSYVFRSFLLYLMEDKRHRILCFWADVQRALASVKDPDLDPVGSDHHSLPPSASNDELHSKSITTANNDLSPLSAPVVGANTHTPPTRTLSQLHSLYAELEDAYGRFYPNEPRQSSSFFIHMEATATPIPDDDDDDSAIMASATAHLLSPRGPYVHSNCPSFSLIDGHSLLDHDIDSHASASQIQTLRSQVRDLITKLRPMCLKMDKILRYTFWPQFCKSEYYHKLSKIKRPKRKNEQHSKDTSSNTNASTSSKKPVNTARLKQALISSLKQQKVTREMLVLECASAKEVQERNEKKMVGQIIHSTTGSSATNHSNANHERDRLFEYVCVLKSTPLLPPRSTVASSRRQSGAGYIGGPPLPPRPPAPTTSTKTASSSPPSQPDATSSNSAAGASIIRGNQSLSMFYRFPLVDHSSSQLPTHLPDLAFPLLPDAHSDHICTCANNSTVSLTCIKDTTGSESSPPNGTTSESPTSPTQSRARSSTSAPTIESDFYGFPVTPAAASVTRTKSAATISTTNNRLFNMVCTQEDGSLLHGCVLQITQTETIEEHWEEVEEVFEDIPMGAGIGADVLSRERRKSSERKVTQNGTPIVSGVGSHLHLPITTPLVTSATPAQSSTTPTPPNLTITTSAPSLGPNTPSSTTAKISQLFDGFAKDVKQLVDRVNTDASTASNPPAETATVPSTITTTSPPSVSPAAVILVAVPAITRPSAATTVLSVPSATNSSHLATNSLAAFYAVAPTSTPAAAIGGMEAHESALTQSRPPLPTTMTGHRSLRSRSAPIIHQHHRVFKAQTQYAIVLLTRHPLFNLLRHALANLVRTTTSTMATIVPEADRQELRQTFPSSQLQGILGEIFESQAFYRLLTYTRVPAHTLDLFGLAPYLSVPSYLLVPPIDFHFDILFRCLSPRRLLLVLECLICERRVLLLSSSNSMLTLTGQAFLSLLYPFHWRYLYVPILPYSLFKYLACPTPFLMGVHSCFRKKAKEQAERDVVLVDLDHDEVYVPPPPGEDSSTASGSINTDAFHFPNAVREQFLAHAARLFQPELTSLDQPMDGPNHIDAGVPSPSSLLTPDKPAFDSETRKLVDPYAAAEAPSQSGSNANSISADSSSGMSPLSVAFESNSATFGDVCSPTALNSPPPPQTNRRLATSSNSSAPPSVLSSRSLLLQLEFIKIWSHLLKQFRNFVIHLSAPGPQEGTGGILLFDTPAFLATKPEHYQPFLTTLLNTSYFPSFLHDRSGPSASIGLEPIVRDAFDRYEASLSGGRIEIGREVFCWRRQLEYQRQLQLSDPHAPHSPQFSRERRRSFSRWIDLYDQSGGIDPSLHHVKYLSGWNTDRNLSFHQIETMPREWWSASSSAAAPTVSINSTLQTPVKPSAPLPVTNGSILQPNLLLQLQPTRTNSNDSSTHTSSGHGSASSSTDSSRSGSPLTTTTPIKSTLYRTRRPSNSSRSNSRKNSLEGRLAAGDENQHSNGATPETNEAAPPPPPFPTHLKQASTGGLP